MRDNDLILLQEHWLFQAQIGLLGEIETTIKYAGKGVDKYHSLPPTHQPRGYGGVAILWKNELDSQIKQLDEGNECIQCIDM
jgi:exonuclease III